MMEIIKRNSEEGKQLQQLYQLAKEIRGPYLDQAITIELLVGDIISQHFCPEEDRRNLFFSLVISELNFFAKIRILEKLLELRYPDLVKKHPTIISELEKVRSFRNRIAHSMLDTSDEFLAKGYTDRIQLDIYKDGKRKQQVVTRAEINERLATCTRLVLVLRDIRKEVIQRTSSGRS